jgi:hypothetical protein
VLFSKADQSSKAYYKTAEKVPRLSLGAQKKAEDGEILKKYTA